MCPILINYLIRSTILDKIYYDLSIEILIALQHIILSHGYKTDLESGRVYWNSWVQKSRCRRLVPSRSLWSFYRLRHMRSTGRTRSKVNRSIYPHTYYILTNNVSNYFLKIIPYRIQICLIVKYSHLYQIIMSLSINKQMKSIKLL